VKVVTDKNPKMMKVTDKTSGLSFDTAIYPQKYKNLHGNSG
jgi:hypothetical protein